MMGRFWGKILPQRKSRLSENKALSAHLREAIGISPGNIEHYKLALRHRSASRSGNSGSWANNERLEFLGDAILGALVAEDLYRRYPGEDEGFLTSMRTKIVNRKHLNQVAEDLGLQHFIVSNLDAQKPAHSLLGDALEALIGAIYLDKGMAVTRDFVLSTVVSNPSLYAELENKIVSFKSTFIEYAQREHYSYDFVLKEKWGESHSLTFKIGLYLRGMEIAEGIGTSKKRAEESAAEIACKTLNIDRNDS